MPRRPALVVAPLTLLVLLTATLAGCAEPTRLPPPEPSAAAPLFASDEEALAAATAAYEEYLAVSNAVLQDGGLDPARIEQFVSREVYESELVGFELLSSNGWFATGSNVLLRATLQQVVANADGTTDAIVYVCTSVEGNDVIDGDGRSQVDPNRPDFLAHEVVIRFSDLSEVVIEKKTQWDPALVCE
jgi:hypothetical protein